MLYALIALILCMIAAVAVLVRLTLTMNEISASLKKIARRSAETKALTAGLAAAAHPAPGASESGDGDAAGRTEAELAAVIAAASSAAFRDAGVAGAGNGIGRHGPAGQ